MSGRFVRSSKYRHVYGRSTRKDQCYDNLRVSKNAWDTNLVKVNPKYISVNWDTSGGGAFAVIPVNETGKLPDRIPLFRGHTAVVLDTDWNPFNDDLIASASDDGKVFLWRVPDNFSCRPPVEDPDQIQDIAPVGRLQGHNRKVGHVLFNPSAENVLASASGDYSVKIWDIEAGASKLSLNVGDIVQSLSWSGDGSMLVTTSRDKKLRIWDPRQQQAVVTTPGHTGAKNSRSVWLGTKDRIVTTGFSRMSDRQYALWDIKAPREPISGFKTLDSISGVCMPFWDDGTQCLYLAGKGDGNIRYFEYSNDKFEYLAEYQSSDPQRGIGFMPKRGVNMHDNEVVRAFKTVSDSYIEPISFIVPRRSDQFQDDIFPPTIGTTPAVGAGQWFDGKNGVPALIDMASLFEGQGMKEVTGAEVKEHTPVSVDADKKPEPPKKDEAPKPKAVSTPAAAEPQAQPKQREAKEQVSDQKAAMSALADKFADKESDEQAQDEEESAFDEEPERSRPAVQRTPSIVVSENKPSTTPAAPAPAPASKTQTQTQTQPSRIVTATATARSGTPTTSTPASPAASIGTVTPIATETVVALQDDLKSIKEMLVVQQKTIDRQTSIIEKLLSEVEELKREKGELHRLAAAAAAAAAAKEKAEGEGEKTALGEEKKEKEEEEKGIDVEKKVEEAEEAGREEDSENEVD